MRDYAKPVFSKRHYEIIARRFGLLQRINDTECVGDKDIAAQVFDRGTQAGIDATVSAFVKLFELDNTAFDAERFWKAIQKEREL
jgi:hypothetical protein